MATVRFSEKLREEIIGNAKRKFQTAVEAAQNNRPDAKVWGDKIWEAVYGRYRDAIATVPSDFISTTSVFNLQKIELSPGNYLTVNLQFEFTRKDGRPWPSGLGRVELGMTKDHSWGNHWTMHMNITHDPVIQELIALITARNQAIADAQKRRDEFTSSVKQVINAHTTLAPALKMWPPLWDLLSEDVKNKHREVTERSAKATAETVGVDLNRLTALASLSKMGGGV